jgi:hypothetical protein
MKRCTKCNEYKEPYLFSKDKSKKDGINTHCKECCRIKRDPDYHKNYNKKYDKIYYKINQKKKKIYYQNYYINNKEKAKDYNKEYNSIPENKEKIRVRDRERYKNNIHNKLGKIIRIYIRRILKNEKWCIKYLGYDIAELKIHIESLWEPWMSWDNYGEWEIDHIIPIDYYLKNNILDPKIINRLDNLQPLLKSHNRSKGKKLK